MQFINFYEPQQPRRQYYYEDSHPQYSYDDIVSYLAQKEYERKVAEEYEYQQRIAEEIEKQRYLAFLKQQEQQRRLAHEQYQRQLIAQARQRQLEKEARQRAQALKELREQQIKERQQNADLFYRHPIFDLLQPFLVESEDGESDVSRYVGQPSKSDNHQSEDDDPEVSIPNDDDDYDLYSIPVQYAASSNRNVEPTSGLFPNPKPQQSGESEPMDLDDFVSNIFSQFLGGLKEDKKESSKESAKESAKESPKSESSTDVSNETEVQPEESIEVTKDKLDNIESKLQNCVETYDRLSNSESSGSDSEYNQTSKAFTSRIKILQKVQMQLEKLYTELDGIKVPSELKEVKHQLTSKSVNTADKVDDLIGVLEKHRSDLLEKELKEKEEAERELKEKEEAERELKEKEEGVKKLEVKEDNDKRERERDDKVSSKVSSEVKSEGTTNETKEHRKPKKIRRVIIETVDDSDF